MEKFSEILNDLIIDTGKSLRQIGLETGIPNSQLSRYIRNTIPKIDISLKLAKYFNCTLDYLFGLSENKGKFIDKYDTSKFISKYEEALEKCNTTNWKLSHKCNFSESGYRLWKHGTLPKMETLIIIAKNLDCSIDYLLGNPDYE